jgi:hypothetical protein
MRTHIYVYLSIHPQPQPQPPTKQACKSLLDDAPLPPNAIVEGHFLRMRHEPLRDEAILPLTDLDEGLFDGGVVWWWS